MKLDQSRLEYYITPEQAAKQLGLDLDSIYQLADEGKLQAAARVWRERRPAEPVEHAARPACVKLVFSRRLTNPLRPDFKDLFSDLEDRWTCHSNL